MDVFKDAAAVFLLELPGQIGVVQPELLRKTGDADTRIPVVKVNIVPDR